MKISANDLRSGDIINISGTLWKVIGMPEHKKPGKGPAYIHASFKNIENQNKLQKRFN